MNILHINSNYIYSTLHQLMIENLTGLNNCVYCPTYRSTQEFIIPNDYAIVSECFKKKDRFLFSFKQDKIFKDLQSRIDVSSFDLLHAYTVFTDGNCAMRISKKYGIPYVVAVRNTDVNIFFNKLIYLRHRGVNIMRNASAVFFLSESYRDQLLDKYIPQKLHSEILEKSYVVPNGIDEFWFDNIPPQKERKDEKHIKLVVACTIDKNKNILATQKAMEILRNKNLNVSLVVVGKVYDKSIIKRIRRNQYTTVLDLMSKEELIKVYRDSDIFIMPSFCESFGLVYVEAMSQGLPVIYSKGQGFDKQFDDGEVGFGVDPYNPCEIAEKIQLCAENREAISRRARLGSEKYHWNKICREYEGIYNGIIKTV